MSGAALFLLRRRRPRPSSRLSSSSSESLSPICLKTKKDKRQASSHRILRLVFTFSWVWVKPLTINLATVQVVPGLTRQPVAPCLYGDVQITCSCHPPTTNLATDFSVYVTATYISKPCHRCPSSRCFCVPPYEPSCPALRRSRRPLILRHP